MLSAALVATVTAPSLAAPAAAAVDGIDLTIQGLPQTFTAGAGARTVTVVVSTDRDQRCQKVRWSLGIAADGVGLNQIRIDRIEQDGSFPVRAQTDGTTALITDVQLDPGQLCPGRTVSARYLLAFDDDARGQVSFRAQAFDADGRLLQEASAASRVTGDGGETDPPSPSPSASAESPGAESPSPESPGTESPSPDPDGTEGIGGDGGAASSGADGGAAAGPADGDQLSADPAAKNGRAPSLLGPGLIVGAVLVFLGVALLMRLRLRARETARHSHHQMPARFYPAP
ncbi:hypothetical protein GCM10012284_38780 [Mangrovihabitans endophyticus]|uniref:Uncharacterized protein n=2 Tax=Mangrovihabitans endophyticus TaxID=1751298 RepID=A0A8J3FQF9_9ACTN|nr:hypothetical protein GCM10012284_38780 [Mangrovihabitans endophyticus]